MNQEGVGEGGRGVEGALKLLAYAWVQQLLVQILVVVANIPIGALELWRPMWTWGFANCTRPLCFVVCCLLVFPWCDVDAVLTCLFLSPWTLSLHDMHISSHFLMPDRNDWRFAVFIHASCWPSIALSLSAGFMWTAFGMKQGAPSQHPRTQASTTAKAKPSEKLQGTAWNTDSQPTKTGAS